MRTNPTNKMLTILLPLVLVACSKLESNDMKFKNAVTESSLSSPSPGEESASTMPDPVVVSEASPTSSSTVLVPSSTSTVLVPSSTSTVLVPSSTSTVLVPSSTSTVLVPSSTSTVLVPSSTSTVLVPSSTSTVLVPSSTSTVLVTETTTSTSVVPKAPPAEEIIDVIYPESEIPVCKLDLVVNGAGNAEIFSIASASKADLISMDFEGFSSLSAAELAAMRKAVDKLVSADGVQVLKDGSSIDKSLIQNNNALIVVDGKESVSLKLSGLGKGIRVYLMNISDAHNTVCFQMNGATSSSQIAMTLKGDPMYVSRASADLNGNGSIKSYMKVLGGNQTGSSLKANSLKGRSVTMITEGKNDTFSSIAGNFIAGGEYNIKIKGKDDTGFGVDTGSIKDSKWNMEIQGEDNVSIMMNAKAVDGNDISGWIKAKSGAKMSAALNDVIDVMPVP